MKPSYDALRKESTDLEVQIKQIQEALDTLVRIQQRSVEANLYNKANEIQEDISMKRFDLRVAQIHLRAINSQVIKYYIRPFSNSQWVLPPKSCLLLYWLLSDVWCEFFKVQLSNSWNYKHELRVCKYIRIVFFYNICNISSLGTFTKVVAWNKKL